MVIDIKHVLEEMGWSDGFYIPVANVENLKLEEEIERLTAHKVKLNLQSQTLNAKFTALEKHFKHVGVEQAENQNLLFARQRQLKEEKNSYILAKMEKERMSVDIKKLAKEFEQVESRRQMRYKDLMAMNNKLDKLKSSIEWDENSIETWTEMLLKRYEDNAIIRKFSEEDKKKAKELEIKRLRLQEEENARKQLVIRTSKEIDTLELTVMRNVQVYKQLYEDRNSLVTQWEASIKHLQQRDEDTLNINREILSVKELIETKRENVLQQQQFHKNEINNNKEVQIQIETGHAEVIKLRKDLSNCSTILNTYASEFESMKRELQRSAELLQKERITIKQLEKENIQKKELVAIMIDKVQKLRNKQKTVEQKMLSASDRVRALEEMGKYEEQSEKGLMLDLEQLTSQMSRSLKVQGDLLNFYKVQTLINQGLEQGLITMEKKKQEGEKFLSVKREAYYKISYKLAILMSKLTCLSRVKGTPDDSEHEEQRAKIEELEEKCAETIRLYNILHMDINRLEDVMRNLTTCIFQDTEKMLKMKDNLQDQKLLVEGAIKMLHINKTLAQQHQVDENVLKVRLNYADNMLKEEGSNIYNLHKQQLQLETMMKERESDILIHKDMLISKRSSLNEDTNRLKLDIQSRRLKTDIYKKRVDAVLSSIGKTEDGQNMTVSYFKLKNAQEKYMLQEEGDKLDAFIKTAEKEIIAMENTLKAVNICNDSFKKSVSMIEEEDEEAVLMKEVEKELFVHTKWLRKSRTEFENQQMKLRGIQSMIEEKEEKIAEFNVSLSQQENELQRLEDEAKYRAEKRHRAEKQIKRVILSNKRMDEILIQDFVTSQLQDFNKTALVNLQDICKRFKETNDTIKKYLAEREVALTISSSIKSSSRSCSSISYDSVCSADVASNIVDP